MPFSDVYRKEKYSDSILSFFGYKCEEVEASYQQGVWLDDDHAIGGKSKVYRTQTYKLKQLTRKRPPSTKELELEDKFIASIINTEKFKNKIKIGAIYGEKYFDPTDFPPILTSVSKYYDNMDLLLNAPKHMPLHVFTIISVVLCVIWFALYSFTFPIFEQIMGYDFGCVVFVFVVPILILLIFAIIRKIFSNKEDKKFSEYFRTAKSFHSLSKEHQDNVRQRYLQHMSNFYGEEAGKILKEYAILKGYDKK